MTKNKTNELRKIKYICNRLDLNRKQLSKIIDKTLNTINKYSSDDKPLSYDDIVLIYNYVMRKQPDYQDYMQEIFSEMKDNI